MSATFAVLAVLMMAAAGAMVAWPMLRGSGWTGSRLDEVNRDIYRQRLAELEVERAGGLLGEAEFGAARAELEHNLLADVDGARADGHRTAGQGPQVVLAVALAAAVPSLGFALYLSVHQPPPAMTGTAPPDLAAGDGPDGHGGEIERMVDRLAARLRAEPEDVDGWMLLGRSFVFLERYEDAVAAFANAHDRVADHPRLLIEYAEALAMAAGRRVAGPPAELARRALAFSPDEPGALWLAGAGAFETGAYDDALRYWRRLLAVLPPGGETALVVAERVADAERLVAGGEPASDAIEVELALQTELAGRARPDDVVLVYARAVDGPPMPLAVVRRQVRDLPLRVRLDDGMAMVEGLSLAGFEEVEVVARVTRTGEAAPRSGDLQGRAGPVRTGQSVRVMIDEVLP